MHIMIDKETWDTIPTTAIRAMAMVAFTPETGEIHDKIIIDARSSVDDQIEHGRTVSAITQIWWQQNESIMLKLADYHPIIVKACGTLGIINEVDAFLRRNRFEASSNDRIWSRGRFDMSIIENMHLSVNIRLPWNYRQEADVRTLDQITTKIDSSIPHDPLEDCLAQIQQVHNAYQMRQTKQPTQ